MAKKEEQTAPPHNEHEEIDAGDAYVSWETWEFPPHERSHRWYVLVSIIGVLLIVYAIFAENYLFAIIVLMMGVILFVNNLRHPHRVNVHLTNLGVVVDQHFYRFQDLKDFSVVYDPPNVKLLYIDFKSPWRPLMSIPLEDIDPNVVRDYLLQYVFENLDRESEGLTDYLSRLYKL